MNPASHSPKIRSESAQKYDDSPITNHSTPLTFLLPLPAYQLSYMYLIPLSPSCIKDKLRAGQRKAPIEIRSPWYSAMRAGTSAVTTGALVSTARAYTPALGSLVSFRPRQD